MDFKAGFYPVDKNAPEEHPWRAGQLLCIRSNVVDYAAPIFQGSQGIIGRLVDGEMVMFLTHNGFGVGPIGHGWLLVLSRFGVTVVFIDDVEQCT